MHHPYTPEVQGLIVATYCRHKGGDLGLKGSLHLTHTELSAICPYFTSPCQVFSAEFITFSLPLIPKAPTGLSVTSELPVLYTIC